jgi:hypothetical protein
MAETLTLSGVTADRFRADSETTELFFYSASVTQAVEVPLRNKAFK